MDSEGLRQKQTEAIVRCLQLAEQEGKRLVVVFGGGGGGGGGGGVGVGVGVVVLKQR